MGHLIFQDRVRNLKREGGTAKKVPDDDYDWVENAIAPYVFSIKSFVMIYLAKRLSGQSVTEIRQRGSNC
jgi:hypothetical protein